MIIATVVWRGVFSYRAILFQLVWRFLPSFFYTWWYWVWCISFGCFFCLLFCSVCGTSSQPARVEFLILRVCPAVEVYTKSRRRDGLFRMYGTWYYVFPGSMWVYTAGSLVPVVAVNIVFVFYWYHISNVYYIPGHNGKKEPHQETEPEISGKI